MDNEEIQGVKFSEFPSVTPGGADEVVGLHAGDNARFTVANFILAIRQGLVNLFVPQTRTVNGKALSSDISIDASDVGAAEPTQVGSISLSSSWSGSGPYSQTVTVTGATVTADSKVDIQLTAAQIASLIAAGVTGLLIENNNGTLIAWAVGASPFAMTVQCTVEDVVV